MNERHTRVEVKQGGSGFFKLTIHGYFGKETTENFVYMSAELPTPLLVKLRDELNTLFPKQLPSTTGEALCNCGYLHLAGTPCPVVNNPLALGEDALAEAPIAVSQADGVADIQDGCLVCGIPIPPGPDFCSEQCEADIALFTKGKTPVL